MIKVLLSKISFMLHYWWSIHYIRGHGMKITKDDLSKLNQLAVGELSYMLEMEVCTHAFLHMDNHEALVEGYHASKILFVNAMRLRDLSVSDKFVTTQRAAYAILESENLSAIEKSLIIHGLATNESLTNYHVWCLVNNLEVLDNNHREGYVECGLNALMNSPNERIRLHAACIADEYTEDEKILEIAKRVKGSSGGSDGKG